MRVVRLSSTADANPARLVARPSAPPNDSEQSLPADGPVSDPVRHFHPWHWLPQTLTPYNCPRRLPSEQNPLHPSSTGTVRARTRPVFTAHNSPTQPVCNEALDGDAADPHIPTPTDECDPRHLHGIACSCLLISPPPGHCSQLLCLDSPCARARPSIEHFPADRILPQNTAAHYGPGRQTALASVATRRPR